MENDRETLPEFSNSFAQPSKNDTESFHSRLRLAARIQNHENFEMPLDFSCVDGSARLCDLRGETISRRHSSRHVCPPDEASSVPAAGHLLVQSAGAIEILNEELTGIHRKRVLPFRPENCHVRSGRPYQAIINLAREIDADLIVLSTRGYSGLKHLLLGSTAERVVRGAPCPVLIARKRKQKSKAADKTFTVRTILVPVDFSNCSLAGVEYAAFMAKKLYATLRLFHAMYPYTNYVIADRAGARLSGLADAVEEATRIEMDALKQMDFLRGLPVQTETCPGHAVDETAPPPVSPILTLWSLPHMAAQGSSTR
ncbi:MAG: Universal stress protein family protein [Candidatus Udaeobacter sp.]|nr:MAG: Universal stress protein family protein [Candidatus Udaeobacter sp.]